MIFLDPSPYCRQKYSFVLVDFGRKVKNSIAQKHVIMDSILKKSLTMQSNCLPGDWAVMDVSWLSWLQSFSQLSQLTNLRGRYFEQLYGSWWQSWNTWSFYFSEAPTPREPPSNYQQKMKHEDKFKCFNNIRSNSAKEQLRVCHSWI